MCWKAVKRAWDDVDDGLFETFIKNLIKYVKEIEDYSTQKSKREGRGPYHGRVCRHYPRPVRKIEQEKMQ